MVVAANISGVSFATAIAALSIGGIVMVSLKIPKMPNIFRNKSMELGQEFGEQRMKALALRASEEKRDGETFAQAIERVALEESMQKVV